MQCPIDQSELRLAERHGVEIDYCPRCRGIWLDRGELDKVLERDTAGFAANNVRQFNDRPTSRERVYQDGDDDSNDHRGDPQRRRGGWLGDLFQFGD